MATTFSAGEEKLIALLLEKDLITKTQERRLRGAKKGTGLREAVQMPLVDPVKFASLQAIVEKEFGPLYLGDAPTEPPSSEKPASPPPFVPIRAGDDDIEPALVIDEAPGPHVKLPGGDYKIENLGPVGKAKPEAPPPAADLDDELIIEDEQLPADIRESRSAVAKIEIAAPPASASAELDDELILDDAPSEEMLNMPTPLSTSVLDAELADLEREFADEAAAAPPTERPAPAHDPNELDPELMLDDDFDFGDHAPAGDVLHELDDELILDYDEPAPKQDAPLPSADWITGSFEKVLDDVFDEAFADDEPQAIPSSSSNPKLAPPAPGDLTRIRMMDAPESYGKPQGNTLNLGDDEGINLIHEVNSLFSDAFDTACSAFVLDASRGDRNVRHYATDLSLFADKTIAPDLLEKYANRVKVMARIQPWKKDVTQKGVIRLLHDGLPRRAFVESRTEAGKEVVTIYLANA